MYRIVTKRVLTPTLVLIEVEAPMIAKKAEPGQFVILRATGDGDIAFLAGCPMMKGEEKTEDFETAIDINADAYIPDTYISDEFTKLDIYKRIALIADDDDVSLMEDELSDRFGKMPSSVEILVRAARTKAAAHKVYITKISEKRNEAHMDLFEKAGIDLSALMNFLNEYPGKLYFKAQPKPSFDYIFEKGIPVQARLKELTDLFVHMKERILLPGKT